MKKTFCRIPGPGETRDCLDPWIFLFVRATGEVDACCRGVTIGNMAQAGLDEIVDGPAAVTLREQMLTGHLPPDCVRCATRGVVTTAQLRDRLEVTLFDGAHREREDLRRQLRDHRAVRSELLKERAALREHAQNLEHLLEESRAQVAAWAKHPSASVEEGSAARTMKRGLRWLRTKLGC